MNWLASNWLTLLGVILIGFGTILTIIDQQIKSDKSDKKITELSQQSLKLSEKNTELAIQSQQYITGGDSWAYLSGGVHSFAGILNQPFGLTLNHVGKNPLYDLIVDVYEVEYDRELPTKAYNLTNVFSEKVGTLNKTLFHKPLYVFKLPNKKRVEYLIMINARNGEIKQHWIFMKKDDNHWSSAMKVFKYIPNYDGSFSKVDLLERIDDNFPEEKIDWIEH